jgi:lipid II:glycine glycyltransferase (peptidoglycan interpeptide bridge formation enzyme)
MRRMSSKIFQKENNLFQSTDWQTFQESLGRKIENIDGGTGIRLGLPFSKEFVWFQKGPFSKIQNLNAKYQNEKELIFIRVEPSDLIVVDIKAGKLLPVTKSSLLSGQASPKATRVLNLTKTEEEILAEMKPKTRYNIRLAEKKGVTVKESANVEVFYEMLTATSGKNTGYFPHEKSYYVALMKQLEPKNLAKIYIAESAGEPLAAIMVTYYGKTATYLHGGQNDKARNLMAPYLCQWVAIKEAKARGCEYYDFWGVAESDDPKDPWAGISRFKEGFGGEKIVTPGSFDLVLKPFWYNILTIAARIKHLVR